MGLRNQERIARIERDSESDHLDRLMREYQESKETAKDCTNKIAGLSCLGNLVAEASDLPDLITKMTGEVNDTRESRDFLIEKLDTLGKKIEESKVRIKLLTDKLENIRNDPE